MKIAIVSDEGQTVSAHFGRAPLYVVVTTDEGKVKGKEIRAKTGHQTFGGHHQHDCHHGEGHGFDAGAGARHNSMIETISDCQVLIAGGMGQGAYAALQDSGIEPVVAEAESIDEAVRLYLEGNLANRTDLLH